MPKNLIISMLSAGIFSIIPILSFTAEFQISGGSRSNGMGDACVALDDFWALQNNQAGLAGWSNIAASAYFQDRFLMKELGLKGLGLIFPFKSGVLGLDFRQSGFDLYKENKLGFAFAKSFGNDFSAGIQLDYLAVSLAENYGNRQAVSFELGVMKAISQKFVLAAHVSNPLGIKLQEESDDRIPPVYQLGCAFNLTDEITLAFEAEKNLKFKPAFKGGVEYRATKAVFVRTGFSTIPSLSGSEGLSAAVAFTFGFGLDISSLHLDIAASMHQVLGWSPSVTMIYQFNSGKKSE